MVAGNTITFSGYSVTPSGTYLQNDGAFKAVAASEIGSGTLGNAVYAQATTIEGGVSGSIITATANAQTLGNIDFVAVDTGKVLSETGSFQLVAATAQTAGTSGALLTAIASGNTLSKIDFGAGGNFLKQDGTWAAPTVAAADVTAGTLIDTVLSTAFDGSNSSVTGTVTYNLVGGKYLFSVQTSSRRYKQNIESLDMDQEDNALEMLRPVRYEMRNHAGATQKGLIAEEVEQVMSDRVIYKDGVVESVDYAGFIPSLLSSLQCVRKRARSLEERVTRLERGI